MQFVLTKHTWQVVEVYHILITEVQDLYATGSRKPRQYWKVHH